MADKKISALTSASTPLAGTEVLPIVQSGSTVKVSVSDLTIGRSVYANGFNFSQAYACEGRNAANTGSAAWFGVAGRVDFGTVGDYAIVGSTTGVLVGNTATNTKWFTIDSNITPAAAAKGVNFTANTPAAGMTSQLLNWYEEGTWTPTFINLTTVSGTPAPTGTYTRVGRMVYVTIYIPSGYTTSTANTTYCNNLPFSASGNHVCVASNASTVDSYGTGLVQSGNLFPPSWTNKVNVVITATYSV